MNFSGIGRLAAACGLGLALSAGAQVPQQFNYQGKLIDGTNLVNASTTMVFRLFNIASGGSAFFVETQTVAIVDGLYSTRVGQSPNFGSLTNAATNQSLYLELQIGGTVLTPREQVVSVMYALKASGVTTGAITTAMLANNAVTGPKISGGAISNAHLAAGSVQSNRIDWTQMPAGLQDGDDTASLLSYDENGTFSTAPQATGTDSIAQGSGNRAAGNYSVVGGGQNNTNHAIYGSIGGGASNLIDSAAQYATIAGGKGNLATGLYSTVAGGLRNKVIANYATVGGGGENHAGGVSGVVGGGDWNTNLASEAVIGGGLYNLIRATAYAATIAGGQYNTASTNASDAVIGGGFSNSISANAQEATIGGGLGNTIEDDADKATISGGWGNRIGSQAYNATIPGGRDNVAAGYTSFAAGRRAKATNDGCFVWADHADADFGSTGQKQFLIRADGGVGIGTVTPAAGSLTVNGDLVITNSSGAYRGNIGPNKGAPFPRPAYDSGWITVRPSNGSPTNLEHNVGGNVDNYVVDLQARSEFGGLGIHSLFQGAENEESSATYGFWYEALTTNRIKIYNGEGSWWTNDLRIRIWVYN